MFSVIIPLYNKSAYIGKAIQSVLDQTFTGFELIVVNDGSTDDGLEVVKSEERRVNNEKIGLNIGKLIIIDQKNCGVSTARNNGVKVSKYDYIAFLDADDWWDKHFLEEMKSAIEEYPDAGLYGCNYYYVKNGVNRLYDKGLPAGFASGYFDYIRTYGSTFCVPINCSFVVIPKNVFIQAGGFNPTLKFGEDFDMWIKLALNYMVAYLNKPLAFSNQDSEISNRAVGSQKLFSPKENVIFNLDYLRKQEFENPELKRLLDGLRVRAMIKYYLSRNYIDQVCKELEKVDFSKQSYYYKFIYKFPKPLVQFYFSIKQIGSKIKQFIIRKIH
jgi:glycosyltransferase involved in cell wall biosynthesis